MTATPTPAPNAVPPMPSPEGSEYTEVSPTGTVRTRVRAGYIWMLLIAYLGVYVALVAPIGISLSLRVQQLAPKDVEIQGYIIGVAAVVTTITGPLMGLWSDRTRSRFGRRRQFAFAGAIIGFIGLVMIVVTPSIPWLFVGWIVTAFGWSTTINALLLSQADRLPQAQYGRVAGLTGFITMVAPVVGVGLASAFIGNNFMVFLIPGAIGIVAVVLWTLLIKEPDNRSVPVGAQLTIRTVLRSLVFSPKQYPDFAWNWLARLLFMTGVTFATTFSSLFYASRLSVGGQVANIGGIITILAMAGVVGTGGGALLGGFLSDRLRRRRIFVLGSGVLFTTGALILALGGGSFTVLLIGSVVFQFALGVFSAVDQAIVLNVLPQIDVEAGRFLGINGYSTSIAQAAAPILAAPLVLIGVTGAEKNYGLLFIVAAVLTVIAGVLVQWKVRSVK